MPSRSINRIVRTSASFLFAALSIVFICAAACFAAVYSAEVVSVCDGDTIWVEHDGRREKIRLNGIDTPELNQPFGKTAKHYTMGQCLHAKVVLTTYNRDQYGRTIADVQLPNGKILNNELVRTGFAWWYEHYAPNNKILSQLQQTAKKGHFGLWAQPNPIAPWDFRHGTAANSDASTAPETTATTATTATTKTTNTADSANTADTSTASTDLAESNHTRPLEGAVDKAESQTLLQGRVKDTPPLQGVVNDASSRSLQGGVKDNLLQERADKDQTSGANLQGQTPQSAGVMNIVQLRLDNDVPIASSAPPLHPQYPQPATVDTRIRRPLRSNAIQNESPPVRQADLGPPQRASDDIAPTRNLDAHAHAPGREFYDNSPPPARGPVIAESPPERHVIDFGVPTRIPHGDGPPVRMIQEAPPPPPPPIARVFAPPYAPPSNPSPVAMADVQAQPLLRQRDVDARHKAKKEKQAHHDEEVAAALDRVRARPLPQTPATTTPPVGQQLTAAEEKLLWDAWYARLNDLLILALKHTMPSNGNPAGSNRVRVLVQADHHLHVSVIQGFDPTFDKAITEAYRSLDGKPELQFPAGTRRTKVEYEADHSQAVPAPVSRFDARAIKGDLEIVK